MTSCFNQQSTVLICKLVKQKVLSMETSPKGFSASKCDVGNWILSKSWEFFEKLFGNFMIFGEFIKNFLAIFWEFLGGTFWEKFFGKKISGRIF